MVKSKIKTRGVEKIDLCQKKRAFGVKVTSPDKPEWKRARVTRDAILKLKAGKSPADVWELIEEGMSKIPYTSETTRDLQTREVQELVIKYFGADPRVSSITYRRDFEWEGYSLYSEPDFFYEGEIMGRIGTEEVVLPLIEVVQLTVGKQKFSCREGKGQEIGCIFHTLDSLGLLLWGREELKGNAGVVKVVFDALKTDKDTHGDYSRPWSTASSEVKGIKSSDNRLYFYICFGADGKIIPNWDITSEKHYTGDVFENFKKTLRWYNEGVESCSKTECESCEFCNICHYSVPPTPKKEEVVEESTVKAFSLTPEQMKVVNFKEGVCIVDAGAGSGKSQSVALRIVKLLENGTKPEDILLLSFSNSAVKVLKERVCKMVKAFDLECDPTRIKIQSFNSIGNDIIKDKYLELGFDKEPRLVDDIEAYEVVLKAIDWANPIEGLDYKNPNMDLKYSKGVGKELFRTFTYFRDNNVTKEQFLEKPWKAINHSLTSKELELIWETYERYGVLLREHGYIDFSDQSNLVEKLIYEDDFLIASLYPVEHIVVDEFQDSNDYQMLLLRSLMLSDNFKSLMVVGDDGQAIYGFRGTSPENMINFEERIGALADDLYLSINHRSLAPIVELGEKALSLSSGCIVKNMTSSRGEGESPIMKLFEKADREATYVAEQIKNLVDKGERMEDIAVISHNRTHLKAVEKALASLGISSQYDMKENMLSNSRVIAIIGLASFLTEGDTKGAMEFLNELHSNTLLAMENKEEIINSFVEETTNKWLSLPEENKKDYLLDLLHSIENEDDAVYSAFVEKIEGKTTYSGDALVNYILKFKLYNSTEGAEKKGEYSAVSLVTAHSSKGKEWKYVFASFSDFDSTSVRTDDFPEIWRLVYVTITRARDFLFISSLNHRGKEDKTYLSNRVADELKKFVKAELIV